MAAIRRVNPNARLIQTDDISVTRGTERMSPVVEFYNERRWLCWDLLCGRVDRMHPLWGYLTDSGASEEALLWFAEHPCPPDIIGVNHYVTSDRWLDHRVDRYPGRPAAATRALPSSISSRCACSPRRRRRSLRCCRTRGAAIGSRSPSPKHTSTPGARTSCDGCSTSGAAPSARAKPVPTCAPSRPGRCSARSTGTACWARSAATTSPARSTCVRRCRERLRSPVSSRRSRRAARPSIRCCRAKAGGAVPIASSASRSCRATR